MSEQAILLDIASRLGSLEKGQESIKGAIEEHIKWEKEQKLLLEATVANHGITIQRVRDFGIVLHMAWLTALAYLGWNQVAK